MAVAIATAHMSQTPLLGYSPGQLTAGGDRPCSPSVSPSLSPTLRVEDKPTVGSCWARKENQLASTPNAVTVRAIPEPGKTPGHSLILADWWGRGQDGGHVGPTSSSAFAGHKVTTLVSLCVPTSNTR